jgi:hypothetical protein
MSRPLTLGLLLCLVGFGVGVAVAQLRGGQTTSSVPRPASTEAARRAVLADAAPLPPLGAAPKPKVIRPKPVPRPVTPRPLTPVPVTPPPVAVPRPPPPPATARPQKRRTETAKPLH